MKIRKIISIILAVCLFAVNVPVTAFADFSGNNKRIENLTAAAAASLSQEPEEAASGKNTGKKDTEAEELQEMIVLTATASDGVRVTMKAGTSVFSASDSESPSEEEKADPASPSGAVKAEEFDPELLTLTAEVIEEKDKEAAVDAALESETENDNIASRKTYDICVLYNGEKTEPAAGRKAELSFRLPDVPSGADEVMIYHHTEAGIETIADKKIDEIIDGQAAYEAEDRKAAEEQRAVGTEEIVKAEKAENAEKTEKTVQTEEEPAEAAGENGAEIKTAADGRTESSDNETGAAASDVIIVTGETGSFSLYTIDFTYADKTIIVPAGSEKKELSMLLSGTGITDEITKAAACNDEACEDPAEDNLVKDGEKELFRVYRDGETGVWYVDSMNPFDTVRGLLVTTEKGQYQVKVTDHPAAPVCKIGKTEYCSIADALKADQPDEGESTPTEIVLISDVTENVSIPYNRNIILDLNGYVLSGISGSVVVNLGRLEIKDSNSDSQTHNFKVCDDGLWNLTSETAGAVAYEALTARPEAGTVVTMPGGCITGGLADSSYDICGGGITNGRSCDEGIDDYVLTLSGGNIAGNRVNAASGISSAGGGVYNYNIFVMNGGTIAGNLVCGSTGSDADNFGGGVFSKGTFTMTGGAISFNSATGDGANCEGSGGGVEIADGSAFTMEGGRIEHNDAVNGGGICSSSDSTLKVRGGTVSYNEAEYGAGVYSLGSAAVTILGGDFKGNTASRYGGAAYICGKVTISGGTFTGNRASKGGGIVAYKSVTLGGSADIIENTNSLSRAENLYLNGDEALITIRDYTGTCGVSKAGNTGVISTRTEEKYVSRLQSDIVNYAIRLNADSQLEIIDTFAVDIQTVPGGTVTASKTMAKSMASVDLFAAPDDGYELEGYTIIRKDTGEVYARESKFIMPNSDVAVTAAFVKTHDIANAKPEHGSLTINGSGAEAVKVRVGSAVTLEAAADAGYALKEYRVYQTDEPGAAVTVTDGSFTMPDYDVTATADFKRAYTVTIADTMIKGTVTADQTDAEQGETVKLTVTPKQGYDVSRVTVKGADGADISVSAIEEGVCTFTMPGQNVIVTAEFEGKGDLQISVSAAGATSKSADAEFTFSLQLAGESGQAAAGEFACTTSDGRTGKVKSGDSITLKGGQTVTIRDLPADIAYEVTGTVVPDGFSATVIQGSSGTIPAGKTAAASFTNTYATEGSVQLEATKTLTGRTLEDGQFSFQLLDSECSGVLRTAACRADGTVTFGAITYGNADDGKTCTYYIREAVPDEAVNAGGVTWEDATDEQKDAGGFSLNGCTYDSARRRVEVAVTDNGNGTMTATPAYYDAAGTEAAGVTIANEYCAAGQVTLSLWTSLKARDLKANEFTFGLYEKDGTTPVEDAAGNAITAKNAADGTVEFQLSCDQSNAGRTYICVARQIVPAAADPGYDATVVYDETPWTFEVTVKDNGNGSLSFSQKVKDKDGIEGVVPIVKNTLNPGLLSITKTVQNGDDAGMEFPFMVKFTSPTGDDLDKEYTFSHREIDPDVPNEQISNPAAQPENTAASDSSAASVENITPAPAPAGANIASGTCGTCSWVIDADGCLTISAGTLDSFTFASMWPWNANRADIRSVTFEAGVIAGDSLSAIFNNCTLLTSVTGLSNLNTGSTTQMKSLFQGCSSLETLDVSGLDTSSVIYMDQMFNKCSKLKNLTLTNGESTRFNTSKVKQAQKMFNGCTSLETLDLSGFVISSGTMQYMNDMFGADSTGSSFIPCSALKTVKLGPEFSFKGSYKSCRLPTPSAAGCTGRWIWTGTGKTVDSLTAAELADAYPDDTKAPAGTWVWEESTSYTVTFNANGGKGSMADMTCEPETEYTLSANGFYRLGYTFTGWNTRADGSGTAYADQQENVIFTAGTALYAQWEAEGPGIMTDGRMEVTLHGNECLTIHGVPAGTQYQVYEQTPSGWVLVSQSGTSGVIEPLATAASNFANKYEPTMAQAAIAGTVTVDGSAGRVNAGDCSFRMEGTGIATPLIVTCGAGGSIAFSPFTYDTAGTFTYTVSQVIPDETGFIEYDRHTETVTVTVTDDGTGKLSASEVYDDSGVAFDNLDRTPVPQGTLWISNAVEGTAAADREFTFSVETILGGVPGQTMTVTVKAGQTVEVGTFEAGTGYSVTETAIPAGYTLKSSTGARGTIVADTASTAGFTNTYAAKGSAAISAAKVLEGGTLADGQFSFTLKEGSIVLQTAACAANGSVAFQPITCTAAGEHIFTISEEVPDDAVNAAGVTWAQAAEEQKAAGGFVWNSAVYDSHTENVKVTASDNGDGVITTTVMADDDGAVFTNVKVYSVTAAACINGTVSMDKARAAAGETITVTAAPAKGFSADRVYYNDGTQHEISPVSGVYSFTMPAKEVTVSASFVHVHQWIYSADEGV